MFKKSLFVVVLALLGVVLGDAIAFAGAGYSHLCLAVATSDPGSLFLASASTTPLAATGSGLDVGAWVFAGIAILIVGIVCTLLPSGRVPSADRTDGLPQPA